jgi:uncharacterized cupredoxin-like copper-binding protein
VKHARPLSLVVLAVTVAAVTPVALGATRPAAHVAKTNVAVTAKEFKFALRPTSARHGSVTFRVTNAGRIAHDFKIAGKKTPLIKPRGRAALTVSLKPGKYGYLCTVPGHAASGMKGSFRVS